MSANAAEPVSPEVSRAQQSEATVEASALSLSHAGVAVIEADPATPHFRRAFEELDDVLNEPPPDGDVFVRTEVATHRALKLKKKNRKITENTHRER